MTTLFAYVALGKMPETVEDFERLTSFKECMTTSYFQAARAGKQIPP